METCPRYTVTYTYRVLRDMVIISCITGRDFVNVTLTVPLLFAPLCDLLYVDMDELSKCV